MKQQQSQITTTSTTTITILASKEKNKFSQNEKLVIWILLLLFTYLMAYCFHGISSLFRTFRNHYRDVYVKDPLIHLNVGGHLYTTHASTLTVALKVPEWTRDFEEWNLDTERHYLHRLVQNRKQKEIFIDRDGKCFEYILNYLRSMKLGEETGYSLPFHDESLMEQLKLEAKFFGLKHLSAVLDYNGLSLNEYLLQSKILMRYPQFHKQLHLWRHLDIKYRLLFRASVHGYRIKDVMNHIESMNNTIIVIESSHGNIFGAYIRNQWKYNEPQLLSNKSFLFSLVNRSNIMVQFLVNKEVNSTLMASSNQILIGRDIRISDLFNLQPNYVNIGTTFLRPSNLDRKFSIEGLDTFFVKEMEIFIPYYNITQL
jgi:hypothetical protein